MLYQWRLAGSGTAMVVEIVSAKAATVMAINCKEVGKLRIKTNSELVY